MLEQTTFEYILFGLALLSVFLPIMAVKAKLPVLNVFARWIRWFLVAGLFALFMRLFELSARPDWLHFVTGIAFWFVLETGYNWIAIRALSQSSLPLFPNFKENTDGDEWPAEKIYIELKDWLRKDNYSRLGALKAELFEGTYLRASVYGSKDRLTRIQILFLPKRKNQAAACYTISSIAEDGTRLITDNHFLPYGGYYPEHWNIVRKPLVGSLDRLLALHNQRLLQIKAKPIEFNDEPLEELNDQQRTLERLNTDIGFLVPRAKQEEEGKITYGGRYRLWKEMWLLAYLGRPVS
ncbi:MAG: hypothetical protein AAGC73_03420 [Verrucomicrobiota bacterium]